MMIRLTIRELIYLVESGHFERDLAVYGREGRPYPRCGTPMVREAFTNRFSHFCPVCQRKRSLKRLGLARPAGAREASPHCLATAPGGHSSVDQVVSPRCRRQNGSSAHPWGTPMPRRFIVGRVLSRLWSLCAQPLRGEIVSRTVCSETRTG